VFSDDMAINRECACLLNRNQLTTSSPMKSRMPSLEANLARRKVDRTNKLKALTACSCLMVGCRSWNTKPIRRDTGHRSATRILGADTKADLSREYKGRTRDPTKFLFIQIRHQYELTSASSIRT